MAGQVIMQGYLERKIPVWVRRLVTMAPALIIIWFGFDPTYSLVLSQVVLSFGIPFALIPLVLFTRNKKLMGVLVNRSFTTMVASAVALLIVGLNMYLLYDLFLAGGLG
jgi:manganese transport protein